MNLLPLPGKFLRLAGSSARALLHGGPAGLRRHLARRIQRWRDARLDAGVRAREGSGAAGTAGGRDGGLGIAEAIGTQEARALLSGQEALSLPAFGQPFVSIVIPVHNQAAYTALCLRSIVRCTEGPPYEVIVVDDASTDETPRLLEKVANVRVVRHDANKGFIASCNDGARQASGRLLCFLNNDTVVTPGWLSGLAGTFDEQPGCGAVGPKILAAGGDLQEAGSILWGDGSASGYGRGDDPSRPEYAYLRDVAYTSGACLLVGREFFLGTGGFDARYGPAYYEDADLCLRAWKSGHRVMYQPRSTVYHLEYGSSGRKEALRQMERNRGIFRKAWRDVLRSRPLASPSRILRARDERVGRRILFMDDRIPTPGSGGGFPRAFEMLTSLVRLGYVVTFFPLTDSQPFQPWLDRLRQQGVEVFHRPYDDLPTFLSQRAGLYDAAIVSRPHNAARVFAALRSSWPGVPIIYDAEAIFSHRTIQAARYESAPLGAAKERALIAKELAPVGDAEAVIVVSEADRAIFQQVAGDRPIVVWGHALETRTGERGFDDRRGVLFVGGFPCPNSPNETAAKYLVREVWPRVRGMIDAPLRIVGGTPPASVRALAGEGIEVTGFLEDLREVYDGSRLFIAPHPVAAGVPLKVMEAMGHGLPCVVSSLLAEQLGVTDGVEALVGADEGELAERIVAAYRDETLWNRLREAATAFVGERCRRSLLDARLGELVNRVADRRRPARR